MLYEVSHRTTYRYSIPVSFSHHLLHLSPRACAHQTCHRTALIILPTPSQHSSGTDYYGNPVTYITLQNQHKELILHARSVIEVMSLPKVIPEQTQPWDDVYRRLYHDTSEAGRDALQFVFETAKTKASADIHAYAIASFPPRRPVLAGVIDLTRRIFKDFKFDPTATTVSTPVKDVFKARRGVCQDFAHLQIACLRSLRLPARYVSGYLMTRPPEGKEKLIGADASHAWVSVCCPEHGWIDVDPTNNVAVSLDHVTLAWGRDYGDVSPVNGAIFGGGAHTVQVAVDVVPINRDRAA
ncbi:MAG: transglutaminase family protein [Rhodospirillales bacterium]|nr:transglutaminase family protein [Rhodospirillales bacterium]